MGLEKIQATMIEHLKLGKNTLKLEKLGILQNSEYTLMVGRKAKAGVTPECWPRCLCCTPHSFLERNGLRLCWKSEMKTKQAIKQIIIALTDENIVFWENPKTAPSQVHAGYTGAEAEHVMTGHS